MIQNSNIALRLLKLNEGAVILVEGKRYRTDNKVTIQWNFELNEEGRSHAKQQQSITTTAFDSLIKKKLIERDPSRPVDREAQWRKDYYTLTAAACQAPLPEIKLTTPQVIALYGLAGTGVALQRSIYSDSGYVRFDEQGAIIEEMSRKASEASVEALIALDLIAPFDRRSYYYRITDASLAVYNAHAGKEQLPDFAAATVESDAWFVKHQDAKHQAAIISDALDDTTTRYYRRRDPSKAIILNSADGTWRIEGAFSYGSNFIYASSREVDKLIEDVKEVLRAEARATRQAAEALGDA